MLESGSEVYVTHDRKYKGHYGEEYEEIKEVFLSFANDFQEWAYTLVVLYECSQTEEQAQDRDGKAVYEVRMIHEYQVQNEQSLPLLISLLLVEVPVDTQSDFEKDKYRTKQQNQICQMEQSGKRV